MPVVPGLATLSLREVNSPAPSVGYQIVRFQVCCGVTRKCELPSPGLSAAPTNPRWHRRGPGSRSQLERLSWRGPRGLSAIGSHPKITLGSISSEENSGFGAAASLECEILCEIVGIPPAFFDLHGR